MTIEELRVVRDALAAGLEIDLSVWQAQYQRALAACGADVILAKGDLSGIQSYLYNVNNAEDIGGGVAKRLRGRSFYLSAICHALADELVKGEYGLSDRPEDHVLLTAGGNFLLVLPARDGLDETLRQWHERVQHWLWQETWGELALVLAWQACSRLTLEEDYATVALALQEKLDEAKLQKYLPLLQHGWQSAAAEVSGHDDIGWHTFPKYQSDYVDECHSCRRLPAQVIPEDAMYSDEERLRRQNLCRVCWESERWGGMLKLPQRNKLDFFPGHSDKLDAINFHQTHAVLRETSELLPQLAAFVPQWPFNGFAAPSPGVSLANDKLERLCRACAVEQTKPGDCAKYDARLVTRFHCLATAAAQQGQGAAKIAVLAADGDEFSYHLNGTPGLTLNDQVMLGKLIYEFFSRRLCQLLERHNGLLIYAGGDDFVTVGPWADVIHVANQMRQDFAEWTNGKLHFSAGIYVTNPHEPVYECVGTAQDYLAEAKREPGKNAVQIASTRIPWARFM